MRLALTGGATGIGAATVARLRADGETVAIKVLRPASSTTPPLIGATESMAPPVKKINLKPSPFQ